jgi:hypothetical protein
MRIKKTNFCAISQISQKEKKERKRQSMTERDVWIRFVKENGEPYKKSTVGRLKSSSDQKIIDFRDKVHAEYSGFLEGIHNIQLAIWEEGGTSALDEDKDTVGNRGNGKANALLVVVPTATDIESATESTRLINRNVSGE